MKILGKKNEFQIFLTNKTTNNILMFSVDLFLLFIACRKREVKQAKMKNFVLPNQILSATNYDSL